MHKGFLIFSLLISVLFAIEKPDGGYATWEDFEKGIPTYDVSRFRIRDLTPRERFGLLSPFRKPPKHHPGDNRVRILISDSASDTAFWHESINGKLTIIKKGKKIYLYKPCNHSFKFRRYQAFPIYHFSSELHYNESYPWFYSIYEVNDFSERTLDLATGTIKPSGYYFNRSIFYIDKSSKKIRHISRLRFSKILKRTPKLLHWWNKESYKAKKNETVRQNYFEDYLEEIKKNKDKS